jgi:hypothetical protein
MAVEGRLTRLVGFKPDEARGVSAFDFGQLLPARDNSEVLEGRGKLCLGEIGWQVAQLDDELLVGGFNISARSWLGHATVFLCCLRCLHYFFN